MHEKFLDLKFTIRANEAILTDIHSKLTGPDSDGSELATALAELVQHALIAADVSADFEVDLHCGSIKPQYSAGGGLHAQTWLETRTESSDTINIQDLVHGHED